MEKDEAVTALRGQLAAAEQVRPLRYDSPERKAWEKETVTLLRAAYGSDSPEVEEFLDAPLPKFSKNMSAAEWQDNYDYLLLNQTQILEKILAVHAGVARPGVAPQPSSAAAHTPTGPAAGGTGIGVKRGPKPAAHPLLQPVEDAVEQVPEAHRHAIVGLENLLKGRAPWPEVRQQLIVVLSADEAIAHAVLRALPRVLRRV